MLLMHWPRRAWLTLLLSGAIAVDGCGNSDGNPSAVPDASVTSTTDTSCVEMVVGPAGGTLNHPAGASLSVPIGALVTATKLSLCGIVAPSAIALGAIPLGQAFQAGPDGQTFTRPVTVTIPFQRALLPSSAATAGVRTAPQGGTTFVALECQANLSAGVVIATTVHFSQFVTATPASSLTVTPAPTLPNGIIGAQYGQLLHVMGGMAPYTFKVAPETTLPSGLGLAVDGYLAGVPTAPGVFAFFVEVSDSSGQRVEVGEAMTVMDATSPTPVLTSATPSSAASGSGDLTIALSGSDFEPNARTAWDGAPIATAFGSTDFLGATIPAADLANAGTHTITVTNPSAGGGTSQGVTFTVTGASLMVGPEGMDGGSSDGTLAEGGRDDGDTSDGAIAEGGSADEGVVGDAFVFPEWSDGSPEPCSSISDCYDILRAANILAGNCAGTAYCVDGTCRWIPTPFGTLGPSAFYQYCKVNLCDGRGELMTFSDRNNFPAGGPCLSYNCTLGFLRTGFLSGGSCGQLPDGGALTCTDIGSCPGCTQSSDCAGVDTPCKYRICDATRGCQMQYAEAGAPCSDAGSICNEIGQCYPPGSTPPLQ